MRWLLGVFLTAGGIVFSHCALAYELDLDSSFSQSEGKLIVIDVFGKVNRSDVSVEDVAKLFERYEQLRKEVKSLREESGRAQESSKRHQDDLRRSRETAERTRKDVTSLQDEIKQSRSKMDKLNDRLAQLERKK